MCFVHLFTVVQFYKCFICSNNLRVHFYVIASAFQTSSYNSVHWESNYCWFVTHMCSLGLAWWNAVLLVVWFGFVFLLRNMLHKQWALCRWAHTRTHTRGHTLRTLCSRTTCWAVCFNVCIWMIIYHTYLPRAFQVPACCHGCYGNVWNRWRFCEYKKEVDVLAREMDNDWRWNFVSGITLSHAKAAVSCCFWGFFLQQQIYFWIKWR